MPPIVLKRKATLFYKKKKKRELHDLSCFFNAADITVLDNAPTGNNSNRIGGCRRKELTLPDIVVKVGESLYMCRPCKREYGWSMELCQKCYTEEVPKHQGHEFSQLVIEHVDDMPDSEDIQLANMWRCTACSSGMYEYSQMFNAFRCR